MLPWANRKASSVEFDYLKNRQKKRVTSPDKVCVVDCTVHTLMAGTKGEAQGEFPFKIVYTRSLNHILLPFLSPFLDRYLHSVKNGNCARKKVGGVFEKHHRTVCLPCRDVTVIYGSLMVFVLTGGVRCEEPIGRIFVLAPISLHHHRDYHQRRPSRCKNITFKQSHNGHFN